MTEATATPRRGWSAAPRLAGGLVAGVAFALSFPRPGWRVLLVPALAALFALWGTSRSPRQAARESFVAGAVGFGVLLRWFSAVLNDFTTLGPLISWGLVVLSGVTVGLLTGLLGWVAARWVRARGVRSALLLAPFLWVGFDVFRERYPFPFPWGAPAAAWADARWACAAAALVGAYGLSFLLTLGAALLALCAVRRRLWEIAALGLWIVVLVAVVVGGAAVESAAPPGRALRAAVLQGSTGPDAPPADEYAVYEDLTRRAAQQDARLVIWPESATPFRIEANVNYRRRVEKLARDLDVDIVIGSITAAAGGGWHNSNTIVRADSGLAGIQPKVRLVPFGEYMPLRFILGDIPVIAHTVGEDFRPGASVGVLAGREATLGPLVCFEAVYPGLAARLATLGADALVNTTNDSWFGLSAGPEQHLRHVWLRTAETGRPLLRAANSGISVLIDRRGRRIASLAIGERGVLVDDVELATRTPPGAAVGGVVRFACAIVAAAALIAAFFFRGGTHAR